MWTIFSSPYEKKRKVNMSHPLKLIFTCKKRIATSYPLSFTLLVAPVQLIPQAF
nr:MAG TPA: hypothetical protein [Caudoviricetes sp.]